MKCRHGVSLQNTQCNRCNIAMEIDENYECVEQIDEGIEHIDSGISLPDFRKIVASNQTVKLESLQFMQWLEKCPCSLKVGAVEGWEGTYTTVQFWVEES